MHRVHLTDAKKERMQRKLSRFIRGVFHKKQKQFKEAAISFDMTPSRFSKLIHPYKPYPPFINAIEYLYSLASIEKNLTLSEFIDRIDEKSKQKEKKESSFRQLKNWEILILEAFESVNSEYLEEIQNVFKNTKSRKKNLESIIKLWMCLKDVESKKIDNFRLSILEVFNSKIL
jgi:hypothetical protein